MRALLLLWCVALALVSCGCVLDAPPPVEQQLTALPSPQPPGALVAGAGKAELAPDLTRVSAGLIGYGGPRTAVGMHDQLWARAVVFKTGETSIAIVTLDQLVVPGAMARTIATRAAALGIGSVFVHATHTHSGDGGYWHMPLAELSMFGPYNEAIERRHVDAAMAAIRVAIARERPAVLEYAAGDTTATVDPVTGKTLPRQPLNANRRRGDKGKCDPRFGRLLVRQASTGFTFAQLMFFSAHATVMTHDDRVISGDWPGALSNAAESGPDRGCVSLVLTCAVGDAKPLPPGTDNDRDHAAAATRLANALKASLPAAVRLPDVVIPEHGVPLREVVLRDALPLLDMPFLPDWIVPVKLPLSALADTLWMPDIASLRVLRLGDLLLVGWPGEPAMAHQLALREAAQAAGFTDAWLVSNVGGWFGYVLDRESYDAGRGYENNFTLYGFDRGDKWLDMTLQAMRALSTPHD
ncbi:MAG: neutral/alkaline non-lysosomal ceramidase N-terminal domain-containing protein [Planctomycetota bacterium]